MVKPIIGSFLSFLSATDVSSCQIRIIIAGTKVLSGEFVWLINASLLKDGRRILQSVFVYTAVFV